MKIEGSLLLNQTVVIDTAARTVYLEDDNTNLISWLTIPGDVRDDWFPLKGAATNTLLFTDVGTGAVTVSTIWRDRNN